MRQLRLYKKLAIVSALVISGGALFFGIVKPSFALNSVSTYLAAVNTFDNQPDGTQFKFASINGVSTNNTGRSGDPFNNTSDPTLEAGDVFEYDTSQFAGLGSSGGSAHFKLSGPTAKPLPLTWNNVTLVPEARVGSQDLYASFYLRLGATLPTQPVRIYEVTYTSGSTYYSCGYVELMPNGTIRVSTKGSGSVVSATSTLSVPYGASADWSRVDVHLAPSTTSGKIKAVLTNNVFVKNAQGVRSYNTNPTNETVIVNGNTGAGATSARFGITANATNVPDFWIDTPQVRYDKFPGNYTPPKTNVVINEEFENQDTGHFNKSANTKLVGGVYGGTAVDGSYSLAMKGVSSNGTSQPAWAEMTQSIIGADKRYNYVSFKYRYDGTQANANLNNMPVVRIRNTNPTQAGGGGHLDIWTDSATGKFKGDLQAANSFDTGVSMTPGQTYFFEVLTSYSAVPSPQGNNMCVSEARVKINGVYVTVDSSGNPIEITSTTSACNMLRSVLFGTNSPIRGYNATYDHVTSISSTMPIDML